MKQRIILAIVLAVYTIFILDLALLRFPVTNPQVNWVPFRSISADWRCGGWALVMDFLGNLVAFLPMGLLPPLIRTRRTALWQVALFSLSLSLAIEATQYVSGRRVPDVDDLMLNTLGGVLGWIGGRLVFYRQTAHLAADDGEADVPSPLSETNAS